MTEHEDLRLREIARRLGDGAAERLDVEATAAAVVARLRERPGLRRWGLRIAAAVVLLLAGGLVLRQIAGRPEISTAPLVAHDLTDLTIDELQQVLAVVSDTTELGVSVPAVNGSLDELDAQQLRAVLRSLEG